MNTLNLSIPDFVYNEDTEPTPEDSWLARHLTKRLCGSLAPLLMLTRHELRLIPLVGIERKSHIVELIKKNGLSLRDDTQTLVMRAIQLFGSIESTPIQVLTLVLAYHGKAIVVGKQHTLPVVSEITRLDAEATLGMFMYGNDGATRSRLWEFLLSHNALATVLEPATFNKLVDQLVSLLQFWEDARAKLAYAPTS